MHKTLDLISEKRNDRNCKLQKNDIEDGKKNIIFLDIDGVIQPYDQRERFDIINMDNYEQCVNVLRFTYSLNIEENDI